MSAAYQLFDALPQHIEAALRASIERFGVLVPITVDQNGEVLDGHHRKRIAEDLRVPFDRLMRVCESDEERLEIARTLNADRRQLSEDQRQEVVAELRRQGHSQRAIAGALGVSQSTIRNDVAELSTSTQFPERIRRLNGGSHPARRPQVIARDDHEQDQAQHALSLVPDLNARRTLDVRRITRVAREAEADRRRAEPIEPASDHDHVEIRHGDFRDVLIDLTDQVDAIITDPPYRQEFWDIYEDLGRFAAAALKRNGVLAVMIGTRLEMLDNVDLLIGRHMRRRHRGIYLVPGQRWRDQIQRVATGYKPILIFARPDANDLPWINDDVFRSDEFRQDDRFHHWGQSESGFASLVGRLSARGQLVVDPFLGGGTTAIVCRDLERRFIGCDTDPAAISMARERLA